MAALEHIGVVGAGSIGSLLAAHLTLAGRRVTVVDGWFPHVEAMRNDGVRITAPDESLRVRLDAFHVDDLDRVAGSIDLLFVAVKAYDSAIAVRLMEPLLHERSLVVPVQNGMTEEWFSRLVDPERLVGCCVHVPAELTRPGRVTRYLPRSRRTFSLGYVGAGGAADLETLAALVAPSGETEITDDLAAVKWAKLAVNTMTNAPAGLTGWTTHRLWSDPQSVPLCVRAAAETLAVAYAVGVRPDRVFGRFDPGLFIAALDDPAAAEEAAAALGEVAAERTGSSESRPSLLQDVDRGRRTEVRYLNGHVVRLGRDTGVATPVNAALEQLVGQIDCDRLGKDSANLRRVEALVGGTR